MSMLSISRLGCISLFLFSLIFFSGISKAQSVETSLIRLENISSNSDDVSPCYNSRNGSIFFSRPSEKGDKDVWIAKRNKNTWVVQNRVQGLINNSLDNEVHHYDSLANTIYFQKGIVSDDGKEVTYGIFKSRISATGLDKPEKQIIKYFRNKSEDQSFCLDKNSNILILSIHGPSSHGVEDLYVSFKTAENRWTEPKNLGPTINTKYEEFTPFLSDDNRTLYFASKRTFRRIW